MRSAWMDAEEQHIITPGLVALWHLSNTFGGKLATSFQEFDGHPNNKGMSRNSLCHIDITTTELVDQTFQWFLTTNLNVAHRISLASLAVLRSLPTIPSGKTFFKPRCWRHCFWPSYLLPLSLIFTLVPLFRSSHLKRHFSNQEVDEIWLLFYRAEKAVQIQCSG